MLCNLINFRVNASAIRECCACLISPAGSIELAEQEIEVLEQKSVPTPTDDEMLAALRAKAQRARNEMRRANALAREAVQY